MARSHLECTRCPPWETGRSSTVSGIYLPRPAFGMPSDRSAGTWSGLRAGVSADDTMLLAMAWDQVQDLFQGIIVCIHSDFRIGGLQPGETKRLHGKLYVLGNDVDELLRRYHSDFGRPPG